MWSGQTWNWQAWPELGWQAGKGTFRKTPFILGKKEAKRDMDQDGPTQVRRERMDAVRRMRASVLAVDPMLGAMCEALADAMGADAAVVTLLLETDQVFIGTYGLRSSPGTMPRQFGDDILRIGVFEELRMDENPAMAKNPMVHGPHDAFRSVVTVPVVHDGVVVGGLNVLTRQHRTAPYDEAALAFLRRGRDAMQAHLAFGVLIRAGKVA